MTELLAVMISGAIGAALRFFVNHKVSQIKETGFPLGTLVVNISGTFGIGLFLGMMANDPALAHLIVPVGVGFFGAYTTFSTWMVQSAGELKARQWKQLAFNLIGSTVVGVGALMLGFALARIVS